MSRDERIGWVAEGLLFLAVLAVVAAMPLVLP